MHVDNEYESRLIDRIAIREAAANLTPRQRRVMTSYYRQGDTYDEIGKRENVTKERVRQLLMKAERKMRERLAGPKIGNAGPMQKTENTPPVGFDRAAFLAHMRGLREWQAQRQQREFEQERATLARMLEEERESRGIVATLQQQAAKADALVAKYQKEYAPPVSYSVSGIHGTHWEQPPYEPPTLERLRWIAKDALNLFCNTRLVATCGLPWLGKLATRVQYPVQGGQVDRAVEALHHAIPANAQLSAFPFELPAGVKGANATNPWASLRASLSSDGLTLFLDVTWDEAI